MLINNAAINLSRLDGRLADLDLGEFTQTLTVNALGPLLVVRELLKQVTGNAAHLYSRHWPLLYSRAWPTGKVVAVQECSHTCTARGHHG